VPGSDSPQRILVADDDDFVRRFLGAFLTRRGYSVELVPNGVEALKKAGEEDYSLFLLDFEMGRPTGLEVILRLRAAGNETPIILMSGSFTSDTFDTAPGAGGVVCIEKPFSGAELEAAIEASIGKSAG
jgi:DNA-binding response OmpR family regulator